MVQMGSPSVASAPEQASPTFSMPCSQERFGTTGLLTIGGMASLSLSCSCCSHSGVQYTDGVLGPLILDWPAGQDPVLQQFNYTYEHVLLLQDWMHEPAQDIKAFTLLSDSPHVPILRCSQVLYEGPWGAFPRFVPQFP